MKRQIILFTLGSMLVSCGGGGGSEPSFAEKEQTALNERIATVINLNGHLCAEVVWVGPVISSGEFAGSYQVNCEEYRDANKSESKSNMVVYMVNPETGTAAPMRGR